MKEDKILVTKALLPPLENYTNMLESLWKTHWLTNQGEYHTILENRLVEYLQASHISLFCNGHMALELLLQAMELEGEVITTPFTFVSTTHAIVRNGLTPVFCDIATDTYNIDVDKIEALITDKTCAILPVHVYGNICNIEEIDKLAKKYNLKVIYDAAHAFGVKYRGQSISNFGDASMFSFHATKVFNTIEGGAAIYRDDKLKKLLDGYKNFGIISEEEIEHIGTNAKMNEFQAIMGICNLDIVDQSIQNRKVIVQRYCHLLGPIAGIKILPKQKDVESNYAYMPILIEDEFGESRDEIYERLKLQNIYVRKYFYPLTNTLKCYENKFDMGNTPVAQYISTHILTLPLDPTMPIDQVDRICMQIIGDRKGTI